jgi:hypothetical protein
MPQITELPNLGFKWHEEWTVEMICTGGADAGIEVVLKMSTDGGVQAIRGLFEMVYNRFHGGRHGGKLVPIMPLEKESYQHVKHGKVWKPVLNPIDWMLLDGPAPAPEPEPASPLPEQPRRRRVA